ncbi:VirB4 family type IV secretion/conjugal transfer ATPase [Sphingomonas sp. CGMCC 1.13654]|uniref:Type IV secretion system protein virB4 n=1 Tax=Sphingomonas chungangi TaxID=2683589 RepID=A0A838KZQ8_9SPHN|nr:VirB4 family type IV secretion/conjugal transfer ATPase [Sphingomonas chungangi]MBA2932561.1 VirB4 family type IV secretion/conjugal transfer ATPase [Sphingomonas chungangi]MVW56184.1 VirB4 family type IV secretion/conjugal transfer ATPase [Sphingomonas chungangi]
MMKWTGPAAWGAKEAKAGDRLPYTRHLDSQTLRLRDGAVMRMIQVPGLPFETEDDAALDHHLAVRETMLRSVLDARFVVYHHVVRRRVRVTLDGAPEEPFAALLNDRWQHRLDTRRLFVNEQVLTIVRRPARGKTGWPDKIRRLMAGKDAEPDTADIRALDAAATALVAALEAYGARQLGTYQGVGGLCSELLEILSAIYNGEMRPVLLPPEGTDLGHHIPYARVSFGLDAIETAQAGGRNFAGMLSVKEYPDATRAGLIDNILRLPHELVLTESFAPADRQIARERIDLAIRRLRSADEEAGAERREMLAARDALGAGQAGFGDHHLSLLVRADDLTQLDGAMASAGAALADMGAIAVREDVNMEPAFWGQFPGNEAYLVRRALISTANAAGFLSLHGMPFGKPDGNHWGPAATVFETTSATPYFFNFHEGDLGNFTVIGPSGSGKTVVLNFLAAQAQKFAPRTILFDKDRGAEIFLRACGGHYAQLQPGQPTGFNPLALPDTPVNRAFLRDWLGVMLAAEGPDELAAVASAVDACMEADPGFRRLRYFRELLSGSRRPEAGDLASRLDPWINAGEHAWLFDNAVDALDLDARTLGFDMTALLDSSTLRTPTMLYLFHRVDERLDGEPTVILIDEGWKALDDPVFAARIRDWLKTLRKRNALVGFATQSARDALDSRIAAAIVEQTATMIFTPNPRARPEDYCEGFGLSEHELELIRQLPAHSRCFLVRHANHSVVARLDLAGEPDLLTVLSGREASVRKLDRLREELGDAPAAWFEALTGTPWPVTGDEPAYSEAAE